MQINTSKHIVTRRGMEKSILHWSFEDDFELNNVGSINDQLKNVVCLFFGNCVTQHSQKVGLVIFQTFLKGYKISDVRRIDR